MPTRKYKTEPAHLLEEGQEIVQTTSDTKYRHKVEMVNLVLSTYCGDMISAVLLAAVNSGNRKTWQYYFRPFGSEVIDRSRDG